MVMPSLDTVSASMAHASPAAVLPNAMPTVSSAPVTRSYEPIAQRYGAPAPSVSEVSWGMLDSPNATGPFVDSATHTVASDTATAVADCWLADPTTDTQRGAPAEAVVAGVSSKHATRASALPAVSVVEGAAWPKSWPSEPLSLSWTLPATQTTEPSGLLAAAVMASAASAALPATPHDHSGAPVRRSVASTSPSELACAFVCTGRPFESATVPAPMVPATTCVCRPSAATTDDTSARRGAAVPAATVPEAMDTGPLAPGGERVPTAKPATKGWNSLVIARAPALGMGTSCPANTWSSWGKATWPDRQPATCTTEPRRPTPIAAASTCPAPGAPSICALSTVVVSEANTTRAPRCMLGDAGSLLAGPPKSAEPWKVYAT